MNKKCNKRKKDSIYIAIYNRQKNSLRSITDSNCQEIVKDNNKSHNLMNSNDLRIQNNIINNTYNNGKKSF